MPSATAARRRVARKGTTELLPRVAKASSEERVSDGMRNPDSEDLLHYCLLLGDGDINNRGEDDEGFNTPVCSLTGDRQTGASSSRHRTCAEVDFFGTLV